MTVFHDRILESLQFFSLKGSYCYKIFKFLHFVQFMIQLFSQRYFMCTTYVLDIEVCDLPGF